MQVSFAGVTWVVTQRFSLRKSLVTSFTEEARFQRNRVHLPFSRVSAHTKAMRDEPNNGCETNRMLSGHSQLFFFPTKDHLNYLLL